MTSCYHCTCGRFTAYIFGSTLHSLRLFLIRVTNSTETDKIPSRRIITISHMVTISMNHFYYYFSLSNKQSVDLIYQTMPDKVDANFISIHWSLSFLSGFFSLFFSDFLILLFLLFSSNIFVISTTQQKREKVWQRTIFSRNWFLNFYCSYKFL